MARYSDQRDIVSSLEGFNAETQKVAITQNDMLSRKSGDGPNMMETGLDMNSNRILNLPEAVNNTEPLRKIDGDVVIAEATAQADRAEQEADDASASATSAANSASAANIAKDQAEDAADRAEASADSIDARFVDNVAEAITLDAPVGTVVETQGYYSSGDGGANRYVIVAGGTGTDDGGSFIDMDNGNQVKGLFPKGRANPRQFGANGLSDDRDAIINLIQSQLPIDWGTSEDTYVISSGISLTLNRAIDWVSSGATVKLSGTYTFGVFDLTVTNGLKNRIEGKLTFDANQNAPRAFRLYSNQDEVDFPFLYPSLKASELSAINVYRKDNTIDGSHGIHIEGAWRSVLLKKPFIDGVIVADGAIQAGTFGAFGIVVYREGSSSLQTPFLTIIDSPEINNVYSEDLTTTVDQDGIIIGTSLNSNGAGEPTPHTFICSDPIFVNCRNRAIKCQATQGVISNVVIRRLTSMGGPDFGSNADIDLQFAGVNVSGLEAYYETCLPAGVVQSTFRDGGYKSPDLNMSDIRITNVTTDQLPAIVRPATDGASSTKRSVNVTNVNCVGPLRYVWRMVTSSIDGENAILNMININASPSDHWGRIDGDGDCTVRLVNNHNLSGSVVGGVIEVDSIADPNLVRDISYLGCTGIEDRPTVAPGTFPTATKVSSLAPEGATKSGLLRPVSFELADNGEFTLPESSVGTQGMILASTSRNANGSQAVLSYSSAAVTIITSGSDWVGGTTSDPGSGNFRAWIDTDQVVIKNASGGTRVFTMWMMG